MKKTLFLIILLCNILFLKAQEEVIYNSPAPIESYKVVVINEDAELREKPNLNSKIITTIRNGNSVKAFEIIEEFTRVKFLNEEGYIPTNKVNPKNGRENNQLSQSNSNTANAVKREVHTTSQSYTNTSSSPAPRATKTTRVTKASSTNYSSLCGASTKKGGSCKRRVSGGGRCWQH